MNSDLMWASIAFCVGSAIGLFYTWLTSRPKPARWWIYLADSTEPAVWILVKSRRSPAWRAGVLHVSGPFTEAEAAMEIDRVKRQQVAPRPAPRP